MNYRNNEDPLFQSHPAITFSDARQYSILNHFDWKLPDNTGFEFEFVLLRSAVQALKAPKGPRASGTSVEDLDSDV